MEIPKDEILKLLHQRGQSNEAQQAEQELPDHVDPERDSGLLGRFGLEPQELIGSLGDRLPGGLGDKLRGL